MRVIHYAGAGAMGGLLAHVAILAAEQTAAGHRVGVLLSPSPAVDPAAAAIARGGAAVERVTVTGRADVAGMAALARIIRRETPEIFHVHLSSPVEAVPAILAARIAGARRIVTTEHAPTWSPLEKPHSRAAKKGAGRLVRRVIAVCRSDAEYLTGRFGTPPEKIRVIVNGVPPAGPVPDPPSAREHLGLPMASRPLVGCAGALEEKKGVLDLLEGAARAALPELALALAGDGALAGSLDARARQLGVRLVLTGRLDGAAVFLSALDVFALPSWQEAMPLALLEAMEAGLPVVAARVGGIPEAIEDGVTGLLVEPRRPDAIAAALRRLHGDPDLAARLGRAAREAARSRFSADRMAREVEDLYREVIAEGAGRSAAPEQL